jgi:hypothetical protein
MKAFLGRLGRKWLRIGAAMGNFQMMALLSATYWLIVPLIAIPLKLFGDPLRLRARRPAAWIQHTQVGDAGEGMKRQY